MPAVATVDQVKLSFLQWLASEDTTRHDWYAHYRDYYDGDHDTQLTSRMRRFLQIKANEEFNTNACPIVVDALAERLNVTGFTGDDAQAEVFAQWWAANRMDAQQGITHMAAVRDGDAYMLAEWSDELGRPVLSSEMAFDGTEGIECHYEDERNAVAFASKRWRIKTGSGTGTKRRLNVYYPDRIEKYLSNSGEFEGNWQPYRDEDGGYWPIPWMGRDGKPLGVPVVHFRNNDEGYNYGQSELKNIIPQQNLLNKAVIDTAATADTAGFPIYYMIGDDPSNLELSPGAWVYSTKPSGGENGVAIGSIPGANLAPLIGYKDSVFVDIARISRTPLSYFQISGQTPAEGSQKQQEAGLVAKAKNRQVSYGNAWEDLMALARRLFNTYGGGGMNEDAIISTQWASPETRNETEDVANAKVKGELGIPQEQLWSELGYSRDEIEHMKELKAAEQQAQQKTLASAMLQAQRSFDSGEQGGNAQMQEGMNAGQPGSNPPR